MKKGVDSLVKELDMARLAKNQIKLKVMMKQVLSKKQRQKIRTDAAFQLKSKVQEKEDENKWISSSSDLDSYHNESDEGDQEVGMGGI